jgi:hypothetical protein
MRHCPRSQQAAFPVFAKACRRPGSRRDRRQKKSGENGGRAAHGGTSGRKIPADAVRQTPPKRRRARPLPAGGTGCQTIAVQAQTARAGEVL